MVLGSIGGPSTGWNWLRLRVGQELFAEVEEVGDLVAALIAYLATNPALLFGELYGCANGLLAETGLPGDGLLRRVALARLVVGVVGEGQERAKLRVRD